MRAQGSEKPAQKFSSEIDRGDRTTNGRKRSSSSLSNVPNLTKCVDIHYSGENASLMFSFRYMIVKNLTP